MWGKACQDEQLQNIPFSNQVKPVKTMALGYEEIDLTTGLLSGEIRLLFALSHGGLRVKLQMTSLTHNSQGACLRVTSLAMACLTVAYYQKGNDWMVDELVTELTHEEYEDAIARRVDRRPGRQEVTRGWPLRSNIS